MYELLQIRAQLEKMPYRDTGSLFELRMALMNAGTLLTSRHLANQQGDKDVMVSKLLMQNFRNIRQYYHIVEMTSETHEQCFMNVRELIVQDLTALYKKLRKYKTTVFELPLKPLEKPFNLGIAR